MNNAGPTMREALGPHLPYLRRYARALTGSQKSGDSYVRAALESLIENPALAEAELKDPRVGLFRLFHAFWKPSALVVVPEGKPLPEHFGQEALLLTAMEGFTMAQTAYILGQSPQEVENAITQARLSIANAIRSRVLIIEDEPIISMHLEQIVEDMGHSVVATAITHEEALEAALAHRPNLVLADIQLADGSSGIDAVKDILANFDVPVIFITAYPERLLTGERPEPTYLVTKPFEPDTIIATIGQALLMQQPVFAGS